MSTLISNCSDTKGLDAAFAKAEKYATDNDFKLSKSKADILKMMAACSATKPPDRPEVKFEDQGKTLTATVGKSKKTVLTLGTKEQAAANTKPALAEIAALLKDVQTKVGNQIEAMTIKSTAIEHFINVGQEGCNALFVLVQEMQKKGNKSPTMAGFKTNASVAVFMKAITDNGVSAEAAIKEWEGLAKQAGQFKVVITLVDGKLNSLAPLLSSADDQKKVKQVKEDLVKMKTTIDEIISLDIPRGTGFLKVEDGTAVGDITTKASMSFKITLTALADRVKKGQEKGRALREQHTGDALKIIQSMA